ncbi:MAG: alpha/beta hydrolase fold domain-containing protein, partial [Candidatus Poseidonia sp.]|nr:alpha/beta hydrolase fold domain-containing protein [Poseidonia sp.]
PPAVVITAGFDLMRDEGEAYAQRLTEAGVKTLYKEFSTEGHGFMAADATKSVRAANAEIAAMFKTLI